MHLPKLITLCSQKDNYHSPPLLWTTSWPHQLQNNLRSPTTIRPPNSHLPKALSSHQLLLQLRKRISRSWAVIAVLRTILHNSLEVARPRKASSATRRTSSTRLEPGRTVQWAPLNLPNQLLTRTWDWTIRTPNLALSNPTMRQNLQAPSISLRSPKRTQWIASTRSSHNLCLLACKIQAAKALDPSRVAPVCFRRRTSRMSHLAAPSRQIHKSASKFPTLTQTISTKQLKVLPQPFQTTRKATQTFSTTNSIILGKVTRKANWDLALKIIMTMICSESR